MSSETSGSRHRKEYLLVGTDDRVATKVVPPTLHVRVQIRLKSISQIDSTW